MTLKFLEGGSFEKDRHEMLKKQTEFPREEIVEDRARDRSWKANEETQSTAPERELNEFGSRNSRRECF